MGRDEDEMKQKVRSIISGFATPLSALSAEECSFLISQYEEHTEHGRHTETERSSLTSIILTAQAAVFALIGAEKFDSKLWPIAALIPLLGLYGLVMCVSMYSRFRRHMIFACGFRSMLELRLSAAGVQGIRTKACELRSKTFSLNKLWISLHAATIVIGTVLIYLISRR
jgi:hypothetical protein